MKKWMVSLVMAALLIVPMGGIAHAEPEENPVSQSAADVFVPGQVPAQSAALDGMVAPVNALVLSVVEMNMAYQPDNDVSVWNSLYYVLSLCGQMDERAELTDDTLILPREAVEDYAAALFADYSGLPALPQTLDDRVVYDAANDSYRLARGDAGLSETQFGASRDIGSGQVQVDGALIGLEDGAILYQFTVTLVPNDSMFGYAISGLDIL